MEQLPPVDQFLYHQVQLVLTGSLEVKQDAIRAIGEHHNHPFLPRPSSCMKVSCSSSQGPFMHKYLMHSSVAKVQVPHFYLLLRIEKVQELPLSTCISFRVGPLLPKIAGSIQLLLSTWI
jgi:hypothetical protein